MTFVVLCALFLLYFLETALGRSDNNTRMHSSRMRTARSLTVSRHILCTPPSNHAHHPCDYACPPQPCMPPATMHAPLQPCMLPATTHTPTTTHAPPATTHVPCNHTASPWQPRMPHPPTTMHAPWQPHMHPRQPCMPPPPCGQTDTCKNITFANFVCRW